MPKPKIAKIPSLLAVFDKVNRTYLGGLCCAGIKWAKMGSKPDNVFWGDANYCTRIIRINRILQDPVVPLYVLEYVVLHECLHLIYPPTQAEFDGYIGKDPNHSDRFISMENQFTIAKKGSKWLDENEHDLINKHLCPKKKE